MAQRFPGRAALRNSIQVWCFDLHWGGRVFRVATRALDLTLADGRRAFYAEALGDVDVRDEVAREGIQESDSVPLAMFLDVDVAKRVAEGHRLERAYGELFAVTLHRDTREPGQTYGNRFPVMSGRLSQPVYADPTKHPGFLTFSLEESPSDDQNLLLEASKVITLQTFSSPPEDSVGKVYPVVIGQPGVYRKSTGEEAKTEGSPAYILTKTGDNANTLLIAGHPTIATQVTIFDSDGTSDGPFTVTPKTDRLGQSYAEVDISGSSTLDLESAEFWVCWDYGAALADPFGAGGLTGLGNVCAWALLRTSLRVDLEKWIAEGGLLNRVNLSLYINEETLTPWSFVTRLLESMQVEVRAGPDGLYPQVRQLDRAMAEGITTVIEGADFEPVSAVQTRTQIAEVVNKVVVRFAPRGSTGDYKRTITIEADPNPDNADAITSEYAVVSVNRWSLDAAQPLERAETITLDQVYDDVSAALIAQSRIQVRGFGYAERTYIADVGYGWLHAGDQFRLQSASLHRTLLTTVLERVWRGEAFEFLLALDDDPIRESALKSVG